MKDYNTPLLESGILGMCATVLEWWLVMYSPYVLCSVILSVWLRADKFVSVLVDREMRMGMEKESENARL
jgi:hypothetical protein